MLFLIQTWTDVCLYISQTLSSLQITTSETLETWKHFSLLIPQKCHCLAGGITPWLLYCISLWNDGWATIQVPESPKQYPTVVCGSKRYDHITAILKYLHWLPIRKMIKLKILLLTFKSTQGCAPLYPRELLVKQANTRTLRSNLLQIPHIILIRFGDRAFCAYSSCLWNELPDNIKAANNVQNFKTQLKTLLFRKEFIRLYGPHLSTDQPL